VFTLLNINKVKFDNRTLLLLNERTFSSKKLYIVDQTLIRQFKLTLEGVQMSFEMDYFQTF